MLESRFRMEVNASHRRDEALRKAAIVRPMREVPSRPGDVSSQHDVGHWAGSRALAGGRVSGAPGPLVLGWVASLLGRPA